jgi:RNA polymerase sigma factor (sigma-70 family)
MLFHAGGYVQEADHPPDATAASRLAQCLARLESGDANAREEVMTLACNRLRQMAHRMLQRYPTVRRYDETDDVVQNAALRLHRALADVHPATVPEFLGLAAVQVRRELIDLARKHVGADSYAANHETNYQRIHGEYRARIDDAASSSEPHEQLARWTRLHEAADSLPADERGLFHLVWYLGADQKEAARVLDCSTRTVKRRWDNVKNLMRDLLQDDPPTP